MGTKIKVIGVIISILLILFVFLYFKYFFSEENKNVMKKRIESVTGQNLVVTVFGYDGKIIKRWHNIQKITSGKEGREYIFFYTRDNKYVQLPHSVWYIAEEE